MTNAEKAGFEAYPKNISYSTIGDVMYDYNAEKRRVYVAGYEQGYKDAINKACEWLEKNACDYEYSEGTCDSWFSASDLVESFKKYMEEQQ